MARGHAPNVGLPSGRQRRASTQSVRWLATLGGRSISDAFTFRHQSPLQRLTICDGMTVLISPADTSTMLSRGDMMVALTCLPRCLPRDAAPKLISRYSRVLVVKWHEDLQNSDHDPVAGQRREIGNCSVDVARDFRIHT